MRARLPLLALLASLTGAAPRAGADDEAAPWDWLLRGRYEDAAVKPAPGLTVEEAEAGRLAARSSVTLVVLPAGMEPPDGVADGAGFLVSSDGLVVGPWSLLAEARGTGPWLWGRTFDGPWVRAFVLGGSWSAEIGVARLATDRRDLIPLSLSALPKDALGKRFVAVGTALRRRHVVGAGTLAATEWFDPREVGGRLEIRSTSGRTPGKGAFPLALRFAGEMTHDHGEGSAVVSLDGRCVGVVTSVARGKDGATVVQARPAETLKPLVDLLDAEARLDAPDLGMRFEPEPVAAGLAPRLPLDLERLRAGKKERGGVVVGVVAAKSPALGIVWPGDIVLEIEGRPVFGEVPESIVAALLAMPVDAPVDVVLWRGGKREAVQVRPALGRAIYGDFQAEHDARGGGRRPPRR